LERETAAGCEKSTAACPGSPREEKQKKQKKFKNGRVGLIPTGEGVKKKRREEKGKCNLAFPCFPRSKGRRKTAFPVSAAVSKNKKNQTLKQECSS